MAQSIKPVPVALRSSDTEFSFTLTNNQIIGVHLPKTIVLI